MKVLENCNTIVASSLEQTTWLRKNYQVRLTPAEFDINIDLPSSESDQTPEIENKSLDVDGM